DAIQQRGHGSVGRRFPTPGDLLEMATRDLVRVFEGPVDEHRDEEVETGLGGARSVRPTRRDGPVLHRNAMPLVERDSAPAREVLLDALACRPTRGVVVNDGPEFFVELTPELLPRFRSWAEQEVPRLHFTFQFRAHLVVLALESHLAF